MADYYPLLIRAISSLPQNTAETRRAVFDRARGALLKQLRSVDPPLPEGEITRERLSLEEAIRRVEADLAPQDNDLPEDAPELDAPAAFGSAADEGHGAEHPAAQSAPVAAPAASTRGDDGHDAAHPGAESPSADAQDANGAASAEDAAKGELKNDLQNPPAGAALAHGQVRSRQAAREAGKDAGKKDAGKDAGLRPGLRPVGKPAPSWKKPALWGALVILVLAIIGGVVVNRAALFDGEPRAAAPSAPVEADTPKSADRVASAEQQQTGRAPAPAAPVAGTQRAVLLEESPGGTSPPQSFEGTVTWKTETFEAGPGLPPEIGVRGVVTIPERQITMGFVLRRNADQTLPASHTIELSFDLPKDFAFGGIASIPGIRVKPNQQAQGVPLAGIAVRVNPSLFLVGLSTVPADRQRNVTLMQIYPWFDVPFVYDNNKRAVILFDKGALGDQVFHEAFAAWGELVEQAPGAPPAQP